MTSITQTPTPARPAPATARMGTAADWIAHFHANADRNLSPEQLIADDAPEVLVKDPAVIKAYLGEETSFA